MGAHRNCGDGVRISGITSALREALCTLRDEADDWAIGRCYGANKRKRRLTETLDALLRAAE